VITIFQENERKQFFTKMTLVTLTFDLGNPKSIQVMFTPYETSVVNSSQDNEQKHVDIVLTKVTFATLTFDLANPNQ